MNELEMYGQNVKKLNTYRNVQSNILIELMITHI